MQHKCGRREGGNGKKQLSITPACMVLEQSRPSKRVWSNHTHKPTKRPTYSPYLPAPALLPTQEQNPTIRPTALRTDPQILKVPHPPQRYSIDHLQCNYSLLSSRTPD